MKSNSRISIWAFVAALVVTTLALVTTLPRPSSALVELMLSIKEMIDQSKVVAEGVVESVDVKSKMMVVAVNGSMKGDCKFKQIKMNIGVGQEWYPEAMMRQVRVGEPVVIFYDITGDRLPCECYTNNFFFQLNGEAKPDAVWSFTHIETRMNRTFSGKATDLIAIVKDAVSNKAQPPPPDKNLAPLSKSELMGGGALQIGVNDDVDGFEASPEWKVDDWGNPTEAAAIAFVEPGQPVDPGPKPGLLGEYYDFDEGISGFPETKVKRPVVRRADKQINIEATGGPIAGTQLSTRLFVRWTGFVRIAKPGKYKFFVSSDDGSRLFLDGKQIIENGGEHAPTEVGAEVELKEGDHDYKLEFFQNGGPLECRALWEGPGIPKALLPADVLFHKDNQSARGQILRVKLTAGAKEKIAVTRNLEDDLSKGTRLLFEAENLSDKSVQVAWGFAAKSDQKYIESAPINVPPGKWHYGLQVNLAASDFKSADTQWKNSAAFANRNQLAKLTLLVYGATAAGGTLNIDRVRLDKGSTYVRSIPLPMFDGNGVSFADFDSDGSLDALLCHEGGNKLFQNRGNSFVDVTASLGLAGGSRSVAWTDIDADGKLDLVYGTPALWKFKDGKFANVTKLLPLDGKPLESVGWLDANGDTKPDLLVSKGEAGLQLLINDGASFKDATAAFGLAAPMGAGKRNLFSIADIDNDGFADILCNHGNGLLLRNEDGKIFKPVTKSKVEYSHDKAPGSAFADFDNDGELDLFIPQTGRSVLLRHSKGSLSNVTTTAGALSNMPSNATSAAWGDINLDGNLDLAVAFTDAPVMLYLGDGKGKFAASPFSLSGFECAYGVSGMSFGDFDNDGDLDLLLMGDKSSGIVVNEAPRVSGNVPLRVRPQLKSAPGMLVRLYDSADKPLGIRQPGLISNVGSQEPLEAFFAVAPGKYKIAILYTDGESMERKVDVDKNGLTWNVEDAKKK